MKRDGKEKGELISTGIDGIQNYWWKKSTEVIKSVVAGMNRWIEEPEQILK